MDVDFQPKTAAIAAEITDFMDYLKKRFECGGGEITVYVRNTHLGPDGDLLITTGEFHDIIPGIRAFMASKGVAAAD